MWLSITRICPLACSTCSCLPLADSVHVLHVFTAPACTACSCFCLQLPGIMRKNFTDVYELKGELGLGGYSICRECCHKKTGEEFAVKVSQPRRSLPVRSLFYHTAVV